MGIRMITSIGAVNTYFNGAKQIIKDEILRVLAKLGEELVRKVRDRSGMESWQDRTGNLRSSVGYGVYEFGREKISSIFSTVLGGVEGASEGQKMVHELAKEYGKAYTLTVMAAMNYASFVEEIESKDVLASAELWARAVIDERLERAKKAAIKKINKL